jgi:3',5'-cyclic AMP phosphodiesterase CpdA
VGNPLHLLNKRFFGWLSWRIRRRHFHRSAVVDALMDDLSHTSVDHLVVTGDLTNLSLVSEFGAARERLKQLGAARDVSIVPGNHDAYVRVAQAASWWPWSGCVLRCRHGSSTPAEPSATPSSNDSSACCSASRKEISAG